MRSISCFSILPPAQKKMILLIRAHFPYPIAVDPRSPVRILWLLVGMRQSCVGKLACGVTDEVLWEEEEGMRKGERRVSSESRWWDFSQLITHKMDSLLTMLYLLIFHIVLLTDPPARPTKVKWREWEHAYHMEIYYKWSHSPFTWSQWAPEITIYADGHEQTAGEGDSVPNDTMEHPSSPFLCMEYRWRPPTNLNLDVCKTFNLYQSWSSTSVLFYRVEEGLSDSIWTDLKWSALDKELFQASSRML